MHYRSFITLSLFGFFFSGIPEAYTQTGERSSVPEKYRWNLADIYPTDEAWSAAKDSFAARIPQLQQYTGTLGQSPERLLACLTLSSDLAKEFTRLSSYASMHSDENTKVGKYLAMEDQMRPLGANFAAAASFIEPEILKIGRPTIEKFVAANKGLEIYRHSLDDILRRAAHTGTEGEEKIIADASLMAGGPESIYGIFADADFPYPEITLSDGKTVKLNQSGFTLYRTVPVRGDRKKVFEAFFGKLYDFRRTFGAELSANVKKDMFYMKARKYSSCLESALDGDNIPVEVYTSLVKNVNANLTTFHRYLNLRKRMMGLTELHYYDLYAPLVKNVELRYTVDEAEKNVLAAVAPLGSDYVSVTRKAFENRWVDFYPTDGKRSGAYSNGSAYDVHPYMLLNYNGKYDDVSTLAHELGHTMHSYLSNKNQPYPTSQYVIFVAEVASTFNEALLLDYMLKQIKNDDVRLSLLGNYLEGIKGTLFRQTQFAEFELKIHERAEAGESLTGDDLDSMYQEIVRKYYGHDQGVCIVDDCVKSEWCYIPHFYYNFYVYQYATALTASSALSEKVLNGDTEATKRYLNFLSSGGSDYPINLLRKAGVDMTTSVPFGLTMEKMNRVMDEMEKILDKKGM